MVALARGVVEMEAVVLEDGSIGAVSLTRLLHPELEQEALAAVRQWKFTPVTLHGRAIPLRIHIEMSFSTR